jgi:hypothetical protein
MKMRRLLMCGHSRNHFPALTGVWILIWKDWIQVLRRFDIKSGISWLALFGLSLGMLIAPDWGTRIWVFVLWSLLIGQTCSKRFASDMNLWVLFHQMPFSFDKILLAEIASSMVWTSSICWFAYGICILVGIHPSISIAVVAPGIIICITLAAVFDILRQSKTDELIAGRAAEMGAIGLLFGLIMAGIPLALVMWISSWMSAGYAPWVASFFGLLLSMGIAYGIWRLDINQYTKIS